MSKGETKHELILLFQITGKEPKKLKKFLDDKGQRYSYSTLKKYYGYYASAKLTVDSILMGVRK